MNIAECSLIYICAINNPHIICSLIYFALPILLFIATFTHVLPRPPRRRRGRFIVPVPTNTPQMVLRIPTVGIAIPHTVPTNTHKMALQFSTIGIAIPHTVPTNTHQMALQFVIFCTSRQIEKREKQTHDVCSSLVFYVLN